MNLINAVKNKTYTNKHKIWWVIISHLMELFFERRTIRKGILGMNENAIEPKNDVSLPK